MRFLVSLFLVSQCVFVYGKLQCGFCQDAVKSIESVVGSNATLTEIIQNLQKMCKALPGKEEAICDKAIAGLVIGVNSTDEYIFVKYSPLAICSILGECQLDCCSTPITPEQIHLVATGTPSSMMVVWTTLEETPDSTVRFGLTPQGPHGKWDFEVSGKSHTYTKGGWKGVIHVAEMTGLKPGTQYYYMVGSAGARSLWDQPNWSLEPSLRFTALSPESGPGSSVTFGAIGDMGGTDRSDRTVMYLSERVARGELDFILHSGDLGYPDLYQMLWDAFLRKIETVAAYVPYMTIPGNHEGVDFDFTPYTARLPMPVAQSGSDSPLYYSFNQGPVHIVGINTEHKNGVLPYDFTGSPQYRWLEADLAQANKDRGARPWIIVAGHRPLYCSNKKSEECGWEAEMLRQGLEPLLLKYKVDVYLTAHVHNYERTLPVANNATAAATYVDPPAPVHVLNGAGGCKEGLAHERFPDVAPDWSVTRLRANGYGVWRANFTHLLHEFYLSSTNEVADTLAIIKTPK